MNLMLIVENSYHWIFTIKKIINKLSTYPVYKIKPCFFNRWWFSIFTWDSYNDVY